MFRLFFACLAGAAFAGAAVQVDVRGRVEDSTHRPIAGATVRLNATIGAVHATTVSGLDGGFRLPSVSLGDYRLAVNADNFSEGRRTVTVTSTGIASLVFTLAPKGVASQVNVTASYEPLASPESVISAAEIAHTPGAERSNSMAVITNYVPSAYMAHDQLHVRGGHQVSWAVDGVVVPNTNIASSVGPQFDPKDIQFLEVHRGGYSAEMGDRTYSVFNVVPRSGFEFNREIDLVASIGSFEQTNDQVRWGGHSERAAIYGSVNGNRTDAGLATPGPEIQHDRAWGVGGFSSFQYTAGPHDSFRAAVAGRSDRYQVPDLTANEDESDWFGNFNWSHTFSPALTLIVSPFFHRNETNYRDAGEESLRASLYAGGQAVVSAHAAAHDLRGGVYAFHQTDNAFFRLTEATDRSRPRGAVTAGFLEDHWRAGSWLTIDAGVRLTHFSGALQENAADPRLGAVVRIPWLHWFVRGSYARFYQAPPLTTVTTALTILADANGVGFIPLRGERDEEIQYGLTIPFRGWSVDGGYYRQRGRNFFDHAALGNSNVFFPLTIDQAFIKGWEGTLRSPRLWNRGSVHLAYARQSVQGRGAVSGGLTDFSPPASLFLLDHDQRHTLSAGFDARLPLGAWADFNASYGSGFTDAGGPGHLPGHTTLDLSLGKTLSESVSLSVHAINLANRRFLLDNSQTFGGTHYADPRQIYAQVTWRIHY